MYLFIDETGDIEMNEYYTGEDLEMSNNGEVIIVDMSTSTFFDDGDWISIPRK
jgi:hypothetical protein